jgi:uncharacterized repeat protein (TIGR02543 family)
MVLRPAFTDTSLILFDSQGGSDVGPQYVSPSEEGANKVTQPTDPTRTGFAFKHWSTSPDDTTGAYNFDAPVTEGMTLYAIWQGQPVGYHVIYWVEKANGEWGTADPSIDKSHYQYFADVQIAANDTIMGYKAGDVIGAFSQAQLDYLNTKQHFPFFYGEMSNGTQGALVTTKYWPYTYVYTDPERVWVDSPVLNGNGSTHVNIYLKRKVYTMNFDFTKKQSDVSGLDTQKSASDATPKTENTDSPQQTNAKWKGTSTYALQAKYEQEIATEDWPASNEIAGIEDIIVGSGNPWNKHYGWFIGNHSRTIHSQVVRMFSWLAEAAERGTNAQTVTKNVQINDAGGYEDVTTQEGGDTVAIAPKWTNKGGVITVDRLYYVEATAAEQVAAATGIIPFFDTTASTAIKSSSDPRPTDKSLGDSLTSDNYLPYTNRTYIKFGEEEGTSKLYKLYHIEYGKQENYAKAQGVAIDGTAQKYIPYWRQKDGSGNETSNRHTRLMTWQNTDGVGQYVEPEGDTYGTDPKNNLLTNTSKGDLHTAYFLYERKSFNLKFVTNGGETHGSKTLQYGAPLKDQDIANPTKSGYIFAGWYYTDPGTSPNYNHGAQWVDFSETSTETMPPNDLTVYAKWLPEAVKVEFYDAIGSEVKARDDIVVEYGSTLSADQDYFQEIAGQKIQIGDVVAGVGQFMGWTRLLKIEGHGVIQTGFNFDLTDSADTTVTTKITGTVKLYALWKRSGFDVTYAAGEGSGTPPVDSKKYAADQLARIYDGQTLIPPEGKVFYGWTKAGAESGALIYPYNNVRINGDSNFIAVYGDRATSVGLTYHSVIADINDVGNYAPSTEGDYEYQSSVWTAVGSNTQLVLPEVFTHGTYQLVGWAKTRALATAGDAVTKVASSAEGYYPVWYDQYTIATKTAGDSDHLYGVWKAAYAITYDLNDGGFNDAVNDPNNPTSYIGGVGVPSFAEARRLGYLFLGWYDTATDGIKIESIGTEATGDKILYAHWQALPLALPATGVPSYYPYQLLAAFTVLLAGGGLRHRARVKKGKHDP